MSKIISVNLLVICSGMHYGWPSPYLPVLESGNYTFQVSSEESSYLAIMPLVGEIFGAVIILLLIDIAGRKKLIVLSSIPTIFAWLFIGFSTKIPLMFFGRFLAGFCDGMTYTAVPMYLGEIASPKTRGFLASLCSASLVLGILFIYILGAYVQLDTTAFISTSLPVILLLTSSYIPESPYFHMMKGNESKAKQCLETLRGVSDVSDELARISIAVKEQNEQKGKFRDLFSSNSTRKGLLICICLRSSQQFTGYAAILFYSETIFDKFGESISSSTASIIYAAIQLLLTCISTSLVDISGRRPLLMLSLSGTAVSLLVTAIFLYLKTLTDVDLRQFSYVPLVALISYIIMYSVGIQTVPVLMLSEIFPTNVKAFALGLVDIYFALSVILVSKFFHWSSINYGMHIPFFTFAACSFIGLIFVIFVVPETKGKTLEDIQNELRYRRNKSMYMVNVTSDNGKI